MAWAGFQLAHRVDPAIAGLTLLALVVASYRLGAKGLWTDETVSANYARLGARPIANIVAGGDPNMGLYYALLNAWARMFGYSEISLRSLSVLFGGLAVPAVVVFGTRLLGRPAALVSGLLLALSPFFVQYEQTARAYALVVLLVVLSSYFFVCELEKPSRGTRLAYVLVSALAIYAHHFAAYLLLAQVLTLVVVKRHAALSRRWLETGGAIVALCLPAVGAAIRRELTKPFSWVRPPHWSDLIALPSHLARSGLLAGAAAGTRLLRSDLESDERRSLARGFRERVAAGARSSRVRGLETGEANVHPLLPDHCPAAPLSDRGRRRDETARAGEQRDYSARTADADVSWPL